MSFVRWSKESSVYVYESDSGYECCMCATVPGPLEMVEHLKEHIAKGDRVPNHVIPSLEEAAKENDPRS